MESLPVNWHLVEEWDNNLVFENYDSSFSVEVTFTKQCAISYSIGFSQLKDIFTLIGFENGVYGTYASTKSEAIEKAIEMMLFIDKLIIDKSMLFLMTDFHSPEVRGNNMSLFRYKNTKPK